MVVRVMVVPGKYPDELGERVIPDGGRRTTESSDLHRGVAAGV